MDNFCRGCTVTSTCTTFYKLIKDTRLFHFVHQANISSTKDWWLSNKKKIGTCPMLGAYTSVVAVCYICVLVWQKWSHLISCLNVFTFFHDGAVIADYMVWILLLWKALQFGSYMYTIYSKVFTCHIAICTQKCSVKVLGYEK